MAYVEEGYWDPGYVDEVLVNCDIVSSSILTGSPGPNVICNLKAIGIITNSSNSGGGSCDYDGLEARIAILEKLIKNTLEARDIQPLFNSNIEEIIFHV